MTYCYFTILHAETTSISKLIQTKYGITLPAVEPCKNSGHSIKLKSEK